jgi:hypothetical protein
MMHILTGSAVVRAVVTTKRRVTFDRCSSSSKLYYY